MKTNNSNNLAAVYILEILNKYSDEEHPLTQREIGEILADRYDYRLERKAIGRNLNSLADRDMGVFILPKKGAYTVKNMFLSDEETRIIIDLVNDTPYLTDSQASKVTESLVNSASSRLARPCRFRGRKRNAFAKISGSGSAGCGAFKVVKAFNRACLTNHQVHVTFRDDKVSVKTIGTPCDMIFDRGRYYFKLYDEKICKIRWIPVEGIEQISVADIPSTHRRNMKTEDIKLGVLSVK